MLSVRNPLFDSLFGNLENDYRGARPEAWAWNAFAPAADVRETKDAYVIELDVPGLSDKEIEVVLENRHLLLKGERKPVDGGTYTRQERAYGRFERMFRLPEDADTARVEARCHNGVLTISIPKSEAAKPKTITVKVE